MHKNYRRKNPREFTESYWPRRAKQLVLNQRSRKRRQRDRTLLKKTILDEESWEKIRSNERPVDWWEID